LAVLDGVRRDRPMSDAPTPPDPQEQDAPPQLSHTVVRGVGASAAGYAFSQVLNLGVYVVLARLLVPEEFGAYAAGSLLVVATLLITNAGISSAVVQRRDRVQEAASTAVVTMALTGTGSSLLMLAAAPLIGTIFDSSQIGEVAAVMAGTTLIQALGSIPEVMLQRRFSVLHQTVVVPAQVVAFGATSIACAAAGLGVWSLVIGQYAAVTTDTVLNWLLSRWRPQLRLASRAMAGELIAFGRHVFASMVIAALPQQLDALIVGKAFGTASLGQFRYGFRLASTPYQSLVAAGSYVIYPAFARIAHESERLGAAFLRSLRWICLLGAPLSLALVPLGVPLAVTLFGDVWRDAGHAAAAMCMYTLGAGVISMVGEALKAAGVPRRMTPIFAVLSGLSIGLMLALIPAGFTAVAAGLSIAAVAGGAYALRVAAVELALDARRLLAVLWPPLLAAAVMAGALIPLEVVLDAAGRSTLPALGLLAIEGLAGAAVYLGCLRVIQPDALGEIREIGSLVRRRVGS
jgi:O-antigen/teichoic acid export membrane protein